jgi:hypothetical protein
VLTGKRTKELQSENVPIIYALVDEKLPRDADKTCPMITQQCTYMSSSNEKSPRNHRGQVIELVEIS